MTQLVLLKDEHIPGMMDLFRLPQVRDALGLEHADSTPEEIAMHLAATAPGTRTVVWGIVDQERMVGCIALANMHPVSRVGGLTSKAILPHHGNAGLEATCKVVDIGFRQFNLNRIECHVHEDVKATHWVARRLAKYGVKNEGVHRQGAWRSGRYRDVTIYAVLRDEWSYGLSTA
jgi:RimJ/RimL family protein N-acetyltransferase